MGRGALVGFVVGLVIGWPAMALANNTHTTGEWYHGLGDGGNDNYYVHPFNESVLGHVHSNKIGYGVTIIGDNPKASKILSVVHNHYDVGTGDLPECAFYSDHLASVGRSEHKHRHHSGVCSI